MRIQLHIMMRVFSLFFLLTFSQFGYTQIIEGGTYQFFTCAGKTETYVYYGGNSSVTNNVYCQVTWTVTGGVILYNGSELTTLGTGTDSSTGISQVNVKWTTEGTSGTITATANTCHNGSSSKTIVFQNNPTQIVANPATVNVGAPTILTANPQFNFNSIAWTSTTGGNLLTTSGASVTAKPVVATTYTAKINFNATLEVNSATVKTIACNSQSSILVNVVTPPITNNNLSATGPIYFYDPFQNITADPLVINGSAATGGTAVISYQWQSSNVSKTDGFADISGATGINYDPPQINQTTFYRRVASSPAATTSVSNVITISIISNQYIYFPENTRYLYYYGRPVTPPIIMGTQPTGTTNTFFYQWLESNDGNNWHVVNGSDGMTHTPSEIIQTTYYSREAILRDENGNIVFDKMSNAIVANVFDPISNNSICCDQTVFGVSTPATITGSVSIGGNQPLSYLWQFSTDQVNWAVASFGNAVINGVNYQPPSGQLGNVYFRRLVSDNTPYSPAINISNLITVNYQNTIPTGAAITNPFLTSTFDVNCQEAVLFVNSLNGNFTNNYGGLENDVYFQINSIGAHIGIYTCYSNTTTKLYLFDANHNVIAQTNSPNECQLDMSLTTGTYYLLVEGNGDDIRVSIGTYSYSDCPDNYNYGYIPPFIPDEGGRQSSDKQVKDDILRPVIPFNSDDEGILQSIIYPNPASDEIIIRIASTSKDEEHEIKICDKLGHLTKELKTRANEIKIDVSDLTSDVYIIQVKDSKGIFKQRLVIK